MTQLQEAIQESLNIISDLAGKTTEQVLAMGGANHVPHCTY